MRNDIVIVIIGTDITIIGGISLCIGVLLSVVNYYFFALWMHEKCHKCVTLRYTNDKCCIKPTKGKFGFHTECNYYNELETNRNNSDIQVIIQKIAIAGYVGEFAWLIGTCMVACFVNI